MASDSTNLIMLFESRIISILTDSSSETCKHWSQIMIHVSPNDVSVSTSFGKSCNTPLNSLQTLTFVLHVGKSPGLSDFLIAHQSKSNCTFKVEPGENESPRISKSSNLLSSCAIAPGPFSPLASAISTSLSLSPSLAPPPLPFLTLYSRCKNSLIISKKTSLTVETGVFWTNLDAARSANRRYTLFFRLISVLTVFSIPFFKSRSCNNQKDLDKIEKSTNA
ncbi:hypothetical protein LELG_03045 [Lodderomyces elongisporus NRRL YB-4239]|uniref:Uncharacterized protein n=1 Tax=Lodderomyces elongisporus (strain ATCC 11503 / CBS 2605 / JCM 1781 / NBRC 1676 / NRRL YB-4239) TaxID=379508 RepID=A5E0A8_LODEL|nr:hypothetical protein LELG_03045 [Lodderomyces elongisporus NRRL YB-4239]